MILVYGDNSCPACQLAKRFLQLRHQVGRYTGFPLVYIVPDSDLKNLKQNFAKTPWPLLYYDEKSWDNPWVGQDNIQAAPTIITLDSNLNRLYEAACLAQMNLWLIKNKSYLNL